MEWRTAREHWRKQDPEQAYSAVDLAPRGPDEVVLVVGRLEVLRPTVRRGGARFAWGRARACVDVLDVEGAPIVATHVFEQTSRWTHDAPRVQLLGQAERVLAYTSDTVLVSDRCPEQARHRRPASSHPVARARRDPRLPPAGSAGAMGSTAAAATGLGRDRGVRARAGLAAGTRRSALARAAQHPRPVLQARGRVAPRRTRASTSAPAPTSRSSRPRTARSCSCGPTRPTRTRRGRS